MTIVVRPENLHIAPASEEARREGGEWRGRVSFARVLGATTEYEVISESGADDPPLRVVMSRQGEADPAPGDDVSLSLVEPSACVVVPEARA